MKIETINPMIDTILEIDICDMYKTSLDIYDIHPPMMLLYLKNYGWHFTKRAVEFAVSKMKKQGKTLQVLSQETVDALLQTHNVTLENNELYDYLYVANMCKADFAGSSIVDEQHMAKYIKDVIDDEDGYDGLVFNRWYADMCKKGIPIDWETLM